ncbi:MAG TPA: GlsB/YeaQ/YmgE family stress response membrane protein [Thermoleophilaceae bacterium]|nr:GlsB/YeaQ/YmgE family stress response membrane protein [Thermoleophilaceae bacterium]
MGILTWALWGLFVGLFARLLKPGHQRVGIILTMVLGVIGSLAGGFLATEVLGIADFDDFDFGSFIIAVATSVLLLAIYDRVDRLLPDRDRKELER